MVDINSNNGGYNVQSNKPVLGNPPGIAPHTPPQPTQPDLPSSASAAQTSQLSPDEVLGFMGASALPMQQTAQVGASLAAFNQALTNVNTVVAGENLGLSSGAQNALALKTMNTLMDGGSGSGKS